MALLIDNAVVCTFGREPQVIPGGALLLEGETIAAVGASAALRARYPDAERWDAGGQLALPGAICAHTHFYGAFSRGMALPGEPPRNFVEILRKLWWRLDRVLDADGVRLSALVSLVDAVRHGTTTLIDHHASPNAIDGSLDVIAGAVDQCGLRACLCYEVTDRNGPDGASAGIAENVRFARQLTPGGRLAASFGLHASFTVGPETLAAATEAAHDAGLGFHIHVAEDGADQADSLARYGLRVGERLARAGVLGPATLCAHCVHVEPAEMDWLARTDTRVSHQPRSNMNNAVGVAPVAALRAAGVTVGLGNDGFSNNMYAELKAAYLVHKAASGDPRALSGDVAVGLAYSGNAVITRQYWPQPLGELSPGAAADVVLLDYRPYTPITAGNLPWHLIFGVDGTHVTATICAGRVLMRDRALLTLDEEAIAAEARAYAPRLWSRFAELAAAEGD
jgi:putative selenium metabolism protein SsnA